ncbi:MAG: lipid IV(A) 3-deoxy-D-manno-octulosonic acid transferase [Betaproteobacteria bacterium]|nr:lipid IV(A) 3-deoxy-D-manno-octulosonic acid transferase [Betaproteobacteria bacterium]
MLTMRTLYTLAWRIAAPLAPLKLWWRGRREPGYRLHVGERYGRYDAPAPAGELVWIHAVSVGETRAAAPLVERILRERPAATVLLTSMTATGRETGRALFGERVVQAWLPYDLPGAMRRFLAHFRPAFGLLMETELWPNLAAEAAVARVPLFLVNGRLSERSARGYERVGSLVRPLLHSLAGVAAQTQADAARLEALGARDVAVTGNLKFDLGVPDGARGLASRMRAMFGASRPVVLAASTRDGEEAAILDALARSPLAVDALLVIVPRHPQRFDDVAAMLAARGISHARRSQDRPVPADVRVVLGDSMGEMAGYYGAADVAFVGGSLVPLGGQNLIEAFAMGAPVIVGPHTFNFADAADGAVAAGAALRVADADAMLAAAAALLDDAPRREAMRSCAEGFLAAHRGAAGRTWAFVAARLPPP